MNDEGKIAMVDSPREEMLPKRGRAWLCLSFFLACYLYMWLVVDPRLIYDSFGSTVLDVPVFAADWRSLREAPGLPGGVAVYAYGFLSQGFYHPWLGALLIVLTALCVGALAKLHYTRIGCSSAILWSYLPVLMVLLMYNHYDHPLVVCLILSLGLGLSLVFEKMPPHQRLPRIAIFCLLGPLAYWLGGAGAAGVFALMTTIHLLLRRAWPAALLALPATAGIIWALADYVFYLSPRQAFLTLTPFCRDWTDGLTPLSRALIVLLYALAPATVPLLVLWRRVSAWKGSAGGVDSRTGKDRQVRVARASCPTFLTYGKRLALPALLATVLVVGLWASHDEAHSQIVKINALAQQKRWPEVLRHAARLPGNVYSIYANHDIDRALYHTGRLSYDMFCFPQTPHALLLTHEDDESYLTQVKMCDTFTELGNVDLAEKLASEFLVAKGHLPLVLERLAWINIIQGQKDTARVYLQALKKDLIYRKRAVAMLNGLDHGLGSEETTYIRRINSCIRRRDRGQLNEESLEEMLTGLLEQNPRNRMAFEYLMACYLLAGRVDQVAANVKYLAGLGYREIPTLYEEALLIHQGAPRQPPNVDQLAVSRGTVARYERFARLNHSLAASPREAALQQLAREFGTSYFFYYRFMVPDN